MAFQPLLQWRPCWQAQLGHGSFLTFDFGAPHLVLGDRPRPRTYRLSSRLTVTVATRSAAVRGDWHLWISFCRWSIQHDNQRLAQWGQPKSVSTKPCICCRARPWQAELIWAERKEGSDSSKRAQSQLPEHWP